jgi:hypothetical protein
MNVTRNEGQLSVTFKRDMEIVGVYRGQVELELSVDLFPFDFYESLRFAIENGQSAYPRINLPFGKRVNFSLERQGGKKNGEVWFTLKTTSPGFFVIELREQEIRNLLLDMKGHMTR